MNTVFLRAIFTILLLICSPVRAADSAQFRFAECIGGGDIYAESAAQYGYDLEAHKDNSERQMRLLTGGDDAPTLVELKKWREIGRKKYRHLQAAVKGAQGGPAWDEFELFHTVCDDVRETLVNKGILD